MAQDCIALTGAGSWMWWSGNYVIPQSGLLIELECQHDIITLKANSLSWAIIWELSKWQFGVIDGVVITKHTNAFYINSYADLDYAAKCKLSILREFKMTVKCGLEPSWKPQVKHTQKYALHFTFRFILISQQLTGLRPYKCQSHQVTLWLWHFIFNSLILVIVFGLV